MNKLETRRITPVATIAAFVVVVVLGLELLVVSGVLELRAGTVAKYAPWAYEPFLKLVGEHPDSMANKPESPSSAVEERPGLGSGMLDALMESNAVVPVKTQKKAPAVREPVPDPVRRPVAPPSRNVDDTIPVG